MFHRSLRDDGLLAMEHTQKLPDRVGFLYQQAGPNGQVYCRARGDEKKTVPLPACHCVGRGIGTRV
jgi:hypothetical protein